MDIRTSIIILLSVIMPHETQQERIQINATVGASFTFPDPVTEGGYFLIGPKRIAFVSKSEFEIDDIYSNRLQWSSNTGLFTLSDLQKNDSGVYSIHSIRGNVFIKSYELKLYDPVPVPVVTFLNVTGDSCTLQCSVEKTEETTVSWFRGEKRVDRSSSEVLLLSVNLKDNDSEHRCEAENPADTKRVSVDFIKYCKLNETQSNEPERRKRYFIYIIIPVVLSILLLGCAYLEKVPLQKLITKDNS